MWKTSQVTEVLSTAVWVKTRPVDAEQDIWVRGGQRGVRGAGY